MPTAVEQTGRILADFDKTKNVDLLHGAVDQMAGVDLMTLPDTAARMAGRRAAARMWLRLLDTIDQGIDPHFDAEKDAPVTRVIPPPVNGVQGGATSDGPEFKKNVEKTEKFNQQITLQRLDTRASELAKQFFTTYFTIAPGDQQDLDAILNEHRPMPARVRSIKKWFADSPPH